MITIARPTPVSIDKNHHTPDRRTSGRNKGVKATRAHPSPMMVITSPARRSRSPWGDPLFTPLACHALTVKACPRP